MNKQENVKMEQVLIDTLRMAPNKDIQAILLETYIQEYGALSDETGEIVRQILMGGKAVIRNEVYKDGA